MLLGATKSSVMPKYSLACGLDRWKKNAVLTLEKQMPLWGLGLKKKEKKYLYLWNFIFLHD